MSIGKEIRISRFLRNNRSVIVPIDHGMQEGPISGLENMEDLLIKIREGGPDAIMLNLGMVRKVYKIFKGKDSPSLILRLDWYNKFREIFNPVYDKCEMVFSVEAALKLGADAVCLFYIFGNDDDTEAGNIRYIGQTSDLCNKLDMPLIVEAIPYGSKIPKERQTDPELVAIAARYASEAGADVVKTVYTGSVESFKSVVKKCLVPVVSLGGAKMDNPRDVLKTAKEIIEAGGSGVMFGRNVWQYKDPGKMIEALKAVVHENENVEDALKILRGNIK
jgi:DhnA family fructose-bisphosphate aldolase class Ia